jgi:cysteine-rich repeat protein
MHRNPSLFLALTCAAVFAVGCTNSDPDPGVDPDPISAEISRSLRDLGITASPEARALEFQLYEPALVHTGADVNPDLCAEVNGALQTACSRLSDGVNTYCWPETAFFFANDVPRCAARMTIQGAYDEARIPERWAFDLSGEPYVGPAPECGNGTLEPGEECDDGNHEMWDGCDPNCYSEEFTGCEAVIEHVYAQQEIAVVDQTLWDGPRTHMMTNTKAIALRDVTPQTCNAALAAGTDVCNELSLAMPFVGWCAPAIEYVDGESGPSCSVQFQVGFQSLDPSSGVYTLELTGLLAFTIR